MWQELNIINRIERTNKKKPPGRKSIGRYREVALRPPVN
jgi:hypothetical protein